MKKNTFFIGFVFLQLSLFAQIPTDSLKLYLPFNDNAIDESGNGNDGIVNGATLAEDRFGNPNSAYYFDGINDYIEITPGINLNTFSISFWFKTDSTKGALVSKHRNSSYQSSYATYIWNETVVLYFTTTISSTVASVNGNGSITVDDGVWHYYFGKYNHDTLSLYIDNVLIATQTYSYDINQTSLSTLIGAFRNTDNTGYDNFFSGYIDDIRIYNRALTQQEATSLYNEGLCYETITVTDTLIINANLIGFNPVTYNNTIKIYPNPTSDHIYIDVDNNSMGYEIKIINTLSQVVFQTTLSQSQYNIDLNTWTGNGTYFVQFYNTNGNLIDVKKIVIQ